MIEYFESLNQDNTLFSIMKDEIATIITKDNGLDSAYYLHGYAHRYTS